MWNRASSGKYLSCRRSGRDQLWRFQLPGLQQGCTAVSGNARTLQRDTYADPCNAAPWTAASVEFPICMLVASRQQPFDGYAARPMQICEQSSHDSYLTATGPVQSNLIVSTLAPGSASNTPFPHPAASYKIIPRFTPLANRLRPRRAQNYSLPAGDDVDLPLSLNLDSALSAHAGDIHHLLASASNHMLSSWPKCREELLCTVCGWSTKQQSKSCYQSHVTLDCSASNRGGYSLGSEYVLKERSSEICRR